MYRLSPSSPVILWTPIPGTIYDVRGYIIGNSFIMINLLGWLILVLSSFKINYFELFGLSESYNQLSGRETITTEFKIPIFYKFVRHPIYTSWLVIIWITPYLTLSDIILAFGLTIYIRIATHYEEKDLQVYLNPIIQGIWREYLIDIFQH